MYCLNDNKQSFYNWKNFGSFYDCGSIQKGNQCPFCDRDWQNSNDWCDQKQNRPEHKPCNCWQNDKCFPCRPDNCFRHKCIKFEGFIKFC